jgi:hypothetical protein
MIKVNGRTKLVGWTAQNSYYWELKIHFY